MESLDFDSCGFFVRHKIVGAYALISSLFILKNLHPHEKLGRARFCVEDVSFKPDESHSVCEIGQNIGQQAGLSRATLEIDS